MREKLLGSAAAVALLELVCAGSAQALDVSIGLGYNTTAATTVATGNGTASYNALYNTTTFINIGATGTISPSGGLGSLPEPQFTSSLINISESCDVCQVNLFVTEQGLTYPTPLANYNLLNVDWLAATGAVNTSTFTFWVDPANGLYSGTNIGEYDAPFSSGADIFLPNAMITTGDGPFSESTEYTLNFGDCSVTTCTATLSMEMDATVPEPASMTLLGTALIALGAFGRRRRKGKVV